MNSNLQSTSVVKINVNRDKASALGITAQQLENTLRSAYGSYQVSTIYAPSDQFQVILELEPQFQQDPNALMNLYISTAASSGSSATNITNSANTANPTDTATITQAVPLSTIATIVPGTGPLMVNHNGRLNAATVSYNLAPGAALGTANDAIDALVKDLIPGSISTKLSGG